MLSLGRPVEEADCVEFDVNGASFLASMYDVSCFFKLNTI